MSDDLLDELEALRALIRRLEADIARLAMQLDRTEQTARGMPAPVYGPAYDDDDDGDDPA